MGVRALSKDSTQRPRPDSNRGPFDPKSGAVTDWPLRLQTVMISNRKTDIPFRVVRYAGDFGIELA